MTVKNSKAKKANVKQSRIPLISVAAFIFSASAQGNELFDQHILQAMVSDMKDSLQILKVETKNNVKNLDIKAVVKHNLHVDKPAVELVRTVHAETKLKDSVGE
ncbi:MAG: hypothetical protein ABWW63_02060 [Glaciecola sp.]|jgi:hypothetical protein